jgi:hypothetical protein
MTLEELLNIISAATEAGHVWPSDPTIQQVAVNAARIIQTSFLAEFLQEIQRP